MNSDFTLKDCLFGGEKIAKNADRDKYVYSSYDIGFDTHSEFSLPDGSVGEKCHYFWSWYELICHIDNKKKDILILVIGLTQGLDD